MLTIICGEDVIASRNYYSYLYESYKKRQYSIEFVKANELSKITKWMGESASLFAEKSIFFTENLSKKIQRKGAGEISKTIDKIILMKDVEVVSWEQEKQKRELKISSKAKIKEFKPDKTIFKFLDACFRGNIKNFLYTLNNLPKTTDDLFIFVMLVRHIRNLLLVKHGIVPKNIQKWQLWKLESQAKLWKKNDLEEFYHGLHKIDIALKTSKNPYSVKKSLDILACYFL